MRLPCLLLAFGFWALMIIHDTFGIVTLAALFLIYLWLRFQKIGIVCLWVLLAGLSIFLCRPYPTHPTPGVYRIYAIKQNYVLARKDHTSIIVYGIKDPNFYDCYRVNQIESISSLNNIHQFSFAEYMEKQNVCYSGQSGPTQLVSSSHSLKSQLYSRWKDSAILRSNFYGIYNDDMPEVLSRLGLPVIGVFYLGKRKLKKHMSEKRAQRILLVLIILYGSLFVFTISLVRFFWFQFFYAIFKKKEYVLSFSMIAFLIFFPNYAADFVFVLPVVYRLVQYSKKRKIYSKLVLALSQLIYFHELNIPLLVCFSWLRLLNSYLVILSLFPFSEKIINVWYQWMENFPLAHFHYVPNLLFYGLVIVFIYSKRKYILVLLCVYPLLQPYTDPFFHVYMLDIGQGDCTLIVEPFHKSAVLIDCGQSLYRDNVKTIIVPVLNDLQVKKLDALILTHSDFDHDGGAEELQKLVPIKQVIRSRKKTPNVDYPFYSLLEKRDAKDTNDESIVSYFSYDGFSYLWMGDAGIDVEKQLMERYKLSVDVLKLGHHGSNTSSSMEFLDQTRPMLGLVSVGNTNRYGHPNSQVISNCHLLGIHTLETRRQGMIHLFSFKGFLFVETASHLIGIVKTRIMSP